MTLNQGFNPSFLTCCDMQRKGFHWLVSLVVTINIIFCYFPITEHSVIKTWLSLDQVNTNKMLKMYLITPSSIHFLKNHFQTKLNTLREEEAINTLHQQAMFLLHHTHSELTLHHLQARTVWGLRHKHDSGLIRDRTDRDVTWTNRSWWQGKLNACMYY